MILGTGVCSCAFSLCFPSGHPEDWEPGRNRKAVMLALFHGQRVLGVWEGNKKEKRCSLLPLSAPGITCQPPSLRPHKGYTVVRTHWADQKE